MKKNQFVPMALSFLGSIVGTLVLSLSAQAANPVEEALGKDLSAETRYLESIMKIPSVSRKEITQKIDVISSVYAATANPDGLLERLAAATVAMNLVDLEEASRFYETLNQAAQDERNLRPDSEFGPEDYQRIAKSVAPRALPEMRGARFSCKSQRILGVGLIGAGIAGIPFIVKYGSHRSNPNCISTCTAVGATKGVTRAMVAGDVATIIAGILLTGDDFACGRK